MKPTQWKIICLKWQINKKLEIFTITGVNFFGSNKDNNIQNYHITQKRRILIRSACNSKSKYSAKEKATEA